MKMTTGELRTLIAEQLSEPQPDRCENVDCDNPGPYVPARIGMRTAYFCEECYQREAELADERAATQPR